MRNKLVTRAVTGALTFAMVATTVVGGASATYAATKKSSNVATVSTQKQLNAALKNSKVKRIVIKTKKALSFKIRSASYNGKKLVINAPKATIVNRGNFNNIQISDAKKYTERGTDNAIISKDPNKLSLFIPAGVEAASVKVNHPQGSVTLCGTGTLEHVTYISARAVTIAKGMTVDKLSVQGDAKLQIEGSVNEISVDKVVDLKISGSTTTSPKVIVTENAAGSAIVADGVTLTIENKTGDADANKDTGKSDATSGTSSGSSGTSGGSSGGSTGQSTALELKLTSSNTMNVKGEKSGDNLTATVTSGAVDVTYEWYCDSEKRACTASTYTIAEQDENSVITVKVTGTVDGKKCTAEASTKKVYCKVREAYAAPYTTTITNADDLVSELNKKNTTVTLSNKNGCTTTAKAKWATSSALSTTLTPGKYTIKGELVKTGNSDWLVPDGWYTESKETTMDVYVQGSESLDLTFALGDDDGDFEISNTNKKVSIAGYAVYAKDVTLEITLQDSTTGTLSYQDGTEWKTCEGNQYTLNLKDMLSKDVMISFKTTDTNATTYCFHFDWKKMSIASVNLGDENTWDLGKTTAGKFKDLNALKNGVDSDGGSGTDSVLPSFFRITVAGKEGEETVKILDWKVEKNEDGSWTETSFDGNIGEWRFTPILSEYVDTNGKIQPYTLTVLDGTQQPPADFNEAKLAFDLTANEVKVTFDSRSDLDKLEFAVYKSNEETAITIEKATDEEKNAGTNVTISGDKTGFTSGTEYVVKARYAATDEKNASAWVTVATGTATTAESND